MSTVKYGTSIGSAKITTTGVPEPIADEHAETLDDSCDPNKLMQCPFDKNHQIRGSRFPYHLLKCGKNHPNLVKELKSCPFNARHLMPMNELHHHIKNCEDRPRVTTGEGSQTEMQPKFQVSVTTWSNSECEEDWNKEVDDNADTFVWGEATNRLTQNKPEPRTTNNLTPGLRAPRTLPWNFCKF